MVFHPDSIWNAELTEKATYADAPSLVSTLDVGLSTWLEPDYNSIPVYFADNSSRAVKILCVQNTWDLLSSGWCDNYDNSATIEEQLLSFSSTSFLPYHQYVSTSSSSIVLPSEYVPVASPVDGQYITAYLPQGALPSPSADGHMVIMQPDGTALETFGTIVLSDGTIVCQTYQFTDSSLAGDGWQNGVTASMIPAYAGLITQSDIDSGSIDHAIKILAPASLLATYATYPASTFDSGALLEYPPYSGEIPMGGRLAIPPGVNIESLGLTTDLGLMIARAAQDYGMIITDRGGSGITISVEAGVTESAADNYNWSLNADLIKIMDAIKLANADESSYRTSAQILADIESRTDDSSNMPSDVIAPTLVEKDAPSNDLAGPDYRLVLQFSEAVVASNGMVTLLNYDGTVACSISASNSKYITVVCDQVFIDLSSMIVSGQNYSVTISGTSFKDAAGNNFSGLSGNSAIAFTAPDSVIYGTAKSETLRGTASADTIHAGAGNDIIYGGTGDDHIYGGDGADVVRGEVGNDLLFGGAGNDIIEGGLGDDWLHGGAGKDLLSGGSGRDRFVFDTAFDGAVDKITDFNLKDDKIVLDTSVYTALAGKTLTPSMFRSGSLAKDANDYLVYRNGVLYYDADGNGKGAAVAIATLSNKAALTIANIELVSSSAAAASTATAQASSPSTAQELTTAAGSAAGKTLTGTAKNDTLRGTDGNDVIQGKGGYDWLHGGKGADKLTGGLGNDVFVFDTPPDGKRDTITDFSGGDKIGLDLEIFASLPDKLTAGNFRSGSMARDANDYLLYVDGVLYYDPDGNGAQQAQELATLTNKAALTHASFLLL